jgi:aspartyl-tRNA(Asn)/glutamyl-tRNA(Gln) amidotransferase subunit A
MVPTPSIEELGRLLRAGTASAVEIVREALREIERWEARLNAFVTLTPDLALEQAAQVDAELRLGHDLGELAGVPVAVKDNLETQGVVTTCGSAALRGYVPTSDAVVVSRLRRAGAVLVGKTNMNEVGWGPDIPRVNNPRDWTRSAGGSSGGSAAAVASGALLAALGTDSGGSVRLPAAFCGVVGMKPTYGRVATSGVFISEWSLSHVGPIATTVADARIVLASITRERQSRAALPKRPTLGVVPDSLEELEPCVEAAVRTALGSVESDGARIVDVTIEEAERWTAPWMATFMSELAVAATPLRAAYSKLGSDTRNALELGALIPTWAYLQAQRYRRKLFAAVEKSLRDVDALITPTVPRIAPAEEPEWEDETYFGDMRWLAPFNLTGHPAVSLPVSTAGLPVGLQLVGSHGRDEELLDVAEWVEARVDGLKTP